eukprot:1820630-Amphidinium_carterae.1
MQEFFTKTRLTDQRPGHRLWVNNKETRQAPPDLDNVQTQPDDVVDNPDKEVTIDTQPVHIPPPPDLEQPLPQPEPVLPDTIPEVPVQVPDAAPAADTAPYKPTHRLTSKQPPPQQPARAIVAQLDDITSTKELRLENNEDKEENDEWSQSWLMYKGLSQGCAEQGVVTIDQQEIIRGSRQEVVDNGTVAERCCYKMGDYYKA